MVFVCVLTITEKLWVELAKVDVSTVNENEYWSPLPVVPYCRAIGSSGPVHNWLAQSPELSRLG